MTEEELEVINLINSQSHSQDIFSQSPDIFSQSPDIFSQSQDIFSQSPDIFSQQSTRPQATTSFSQQSTQPPSCPISIIQLSSDSESELQNYPPSPVFSKKRRLVDNTLTEYQRLQSESEHQLVNSRGTQTNLCCVMREDIKLFNKYITAEDQLSTVTSFFTENTLACDETPVYVDRLVQTVESGGLVTNQNEQTEQFESSNIHIYTENHLSGTVRILNLCDSFTQTIIQYVPDGE